MKVKELIELLKKVNPESEVTVNVDGCGYDDPTVVVWDRGEVSLGEPPYYEEKHGGYKIIKP